MSMKKAVLIMVLLLIPAGLRQAVAQDPEPGGSTSPTEPGQDQPPNTYCTGGTCGVRSVNGTWATFNCPTTGNLVCPSNKICSCVCTVTIGGTTVANACINPPIASQPDEHQTSQTSGHQEPGLP